MITKFHIDNGVNDYAVIQEPDKHEDERQQLISEGYRPYARYYVEEGKQEELWVR